jgi:hypothetical protein
MTIEIQPDAACLPACLREKLQSANRLDPSRLGSSKICSPQLSSIIRDCTSLR